MGRGWEQELFSEDPLTGGEWWRRSRNRRSQADLPLRSVATSLFSFLSKNRFLPAAGRYVTIGRGFLFRTVKTRERNSRYHGKDPMNYFSLSFAILLSGLFIAYFIVPKRIRWICLLVASYGFYYFAGGIQVMGFLLFTTLSIFFCARILGRISAEKNQALKALKDAGKEEKNRIKAGAKRKKSAVLALGLLSNLGILAVLKYAGFVVVNLSALLDFKAGTLDMLLPLGISFYTFQAT